MVWAASRLIRRTSLDLVLVGVVSQLLMGYLPVISMHMYDTKRQLAKTLDP